MTAADAVPTVTLGDELSVSAIGFGAMALTQELALRGPRIARINRARQVYLAP